MRTRQPSLQENCNRFDQQTEMGTQTPDAAGGTAPVFGSEHSYSTFPANSTSLEGASIVEPTWHGPLVVGGREEALPKSKNDGLDDSQARALGEETSDSKHQNLPKPPSPPDHFEELAHILRTEMPGAAGDELAEAFLGATLLPPVTRQSLSELDIHNIINNVKLRHDINFDRNLSFRPNLDGVRGQAKTRVTEKYGKALVAELELYARLHHGTPALKDMDDNHQAQLKLHARRRIPTMFETIQEVLRSLVPERDHSRVNEHLDVDMLMQEIERGVCDFTRLAEWIAQLLKEHCAPMRDGWVDEMVCCVQQGVVACEAEMVVDGLRKLFAILEIMKLDVANHQIRNLKVILVEDSVNFEKQHHLQRLVSGRSGIDIDVARTWYQQATLKFIEHDAYERQITPAIQLQIFTRAVLAQFFSHDDHCVFPETFCLDEDRLRTLKVEIENVIRLEVCHDVFVFFLRHFKYDQDVPPTVRQQLRTSLMAIMGDAMYYSARDWISNSEALSLELLREASTLSGQISAPTYEMLSVANDYLIRALESASYTHNARARATLLDRVSVCLERHVKSTPIDLFNALAPKTNGSPTIHKNLVHLQSDQNISDTLDTCNAKWQDIASRVTHIILFHWRVWKDVAYVFQDSPNAGTSPMPSHLRAPIRPQPYGS